MRLADCPIRPALDVIEGKWKPMILYCLMSGKKRFGELQRLLPEATQKVLTQQLRELERDEIIIRKVHSTVPPKVEYSFGPKGTALQPALLQLCEWTKLHLPGRKLV
jgi:DNA-binding HxlR family transcriptional regulator